jgi:hypothetical protein
VIAKISNFRGLQVPNYSGDIKKLLKIPKNNVVIQQIGESAVHALHDFQDNVP